MFNRPPNLSAIKIALSSSESTNPGNPLVDSVAAIAHPQSTLPDDNELLHLRDSVSQHADEKSILRLAKFGNDADIEACYLATHSREDKAIFYEVLKSILANSIVDKSTNKSVRFLKFIVFHFIEKLDCELINTEAKALELWNNSYCNCRISPTKWCEIAKKFDGLAFEISKSAEIAVFWKKIDILNLAGISPSIITNLINHRALYFTAIDYFELSKLQTTAENIALCLQKFRAYLVEYEGQTFEMEDSITNRLFELTQDEAYNPEKIYASRNDELAKNKHLQFKNEIVIKLYDAFAVGGDNEGACALKIASAITNWILANEETSPIHLEPDEIEQIKKNPRMQIYLTSEHTAFAKQVASQYDFILETNLSTRAVKDTLMPWSSFRSFGLGASGGLKQTIQTPTQCLLDDEELDKTQYRR